MKRILVLLFAMMFAGSVFAHQCPRLISQIDHQLEQEDVASDVEERIKALRDEGQKLHDEGDHDASVEKLSEALELLAEEAYDVDAY